MNQLTKCLELESNTTEWRCRRDEMVKQILENPLESSQQLLLLFHIERLLRENIPGRYNHICQLLFESSQSQLMTVDDRMQRLEEYINQKRKLIQDIHHTLEQLSFEHGPSIQQCHREFQQFFQQNNFSMFLADIDGFAQQLSTIRQQVSCQFQQAFQQLHQQYQSNKQLLQGQLLNQQLLQHQQRPPQCQQHHPQHQQRFLQYQQRTQQQQAQSNQPILLYKNLINQILSFQQKLGKVIDSLQYHLSSQKQFFEQQ